jgi:hypothetical protein
VEVPVGTRTSCRLRTDEEEEQVSVDRRTTSGEQGVGRQVRGGREVQDWHFKAT